MVFGLYFFRRNNPFDNAFFVNDESGTEGTHVFCVRTCFFLPIHRRSLPVCVSVSAISVNGSWFLFDEFLV